MRITISRIWIFLNQPRTENYFPKKYTHVDQNETVHFSNITISPSNTKTISWKRICTVPPKWISPFVEYNHIPSTKKRKSICQRTLWQGRPKCLFLEYDCFSIDQKEKGYLSKNIMMMSTKKKMVMCWKICPLRPFLEFVHFLIEEEERHYKPKNSRRPKCESLFLDDFFSIQQEEKDYFLKTFIPMSTSMIKSISRICLYLYRQRRERQFVDEHKADGDLNEYVYF